MKKYFVFLLVICFLPFTSAHASNLTIGTITPNTTVPAGMTVSFPITYIYTTRPAYTIVDPLPGSTLSNANINQFGQFTWTPTDQDVGTHNLTITAIDTYGNRDSISQTLTIHPSSSIKVESVSPGTTVLPNHFMSFIVAIPGFVNPTFTVDDSFPLGSLTSHDIGPSGIVGWTPKLTDVGVHNFSITVRGANGRTDTAYQTITVRGISIQKAFRQTVTPGTAVTFSVASYGLNSPSYTIGDSLRNNTITRSNLSGADFSWIPETRDIGTHVISVDAVDVDGNTAHAQITITVTPNGAVASVTPIPVTPPTPVPTAVTFTTYLHPGSVGNEVRALQNFLIKNHYLLVAATGYYGPATEAAVIKLQKANGLTPLGVVGPATRALLNGR